MSLKRIDQIIFELYPQLSRNKIQSLIEKSKISLLQENQTWTPLTKSGQKFVADHITIEKIRISQDEELDYVSRGALKLKEAFRKFNLSAKDCVCLDVGLSTGGFSDFLLQEGAKKILGIDVGRDQLHDKLKKEKRLISFDKINAKEGIPAEILNQFFGSEKVSFDHIVIDVSFISLSLIIPAMVKLLNKSGWIVVLIKPQFELTRKDLNKKGVVKDNSLREQVLKKIDGVFKENGLKVEDYCLSPIEGENGNKEFLMLARYL
jgi:23S rRNA (cytidine1920-2'-O)/16S rRNA (cytidine1409-2'-O)-methyltransferase